MKKLVLLLYRFLQFIFPFKKQLLLSQNSVEASAETPIEVSTTLSTTVYRVAAENFETESYLKSLSFNDIAHDPEMPRRFPNSPKPPIKPKSPYMVNGSFEEKPIVHSNQVTREEAFKLAGLQNSTKEISTYYDGTQAAVTNILKKE